MGSHEFLLVAGSSSGGGDMKSSELIIDTSFRQAPLACAPYCLEPQVLCAHAVLVLASSVPH